jgi:penicillin-binding protein 1A
VVGSVLTGRLGGAGGGSTITQQLALNLFLVRHRTLRRKIREALLAINLEKRLTKDQILTRYANLIYFGRGAYGVEAAAHAYFDRPVGELDLSEQALLAAIIPSPERKFNPTTQPEAARDRRDRVLATMLELGMIDDAAYARAVDRPLAVVPRRTGGGPTSYVLERIRQELVSTYGQEAVYAGGLEVHVTVDPRLQQMAEDAVREGLVELDQVLGWHDPPSLGQDEEPDTYRDPSWTSDRLVPGGMVRAVVRSVSAESARVRVAGFEATIPRASARWTRASSLERLLSPGDLVLVRLPSSLPERGSVAVEANAAAVEVELVQEPEIEGALVVLDTHTGAVLAEVGGFDFARSEFNRATQAVRQCGSAFKPVVYLTAFEHGMTPADTLLDAPFLLPGAGGEMTYCPKNFYPAYYGITTLRRAVEMSYNATAVKLQELVGPTRVIDTARRLGISSTLEPYPSMALGAFGVRLIELTRAYAAIGGLGELPEVHVISEARDRDGRLLEQVIPRSKRVVAAPVSFLMLNVLRGVVDRGTARPLLAGVDLDLAGKTGTTDEYTDAWFVGMTPSGSADLEALHRQLCGVDRRRDQGRDVSGAGRGGADGGRRRNWPAALRREPPEGARGIPLRHRAVRGHHAGRAGARRAAVAVPASRLHPAPGRADADPSGDRGRRPQDARRVRYHVTAAVSPRSRGKEGPRGSVAHSTGWRTVGPQRDRAGRERRRPRQRGREQPCAIWIDAGATPRSGGPG